MALALTLKSWSNPKLQSDSAFRSLRLTTDKEPSPSSPSHNEIPARPNLLASIAALLKTGQEAAFHIDHVVPAIVGGNTSAARPPGAISADMQTSWLPERLVPAGFISRTVLPRSTLRCFDFPD